MDNNFTLNQIQLNKLKKVDLIKIIRVLFKKLDKKEQDILSRRFGLKGENKETLEKVGKAHNLTRERIRQIERGGLKKVKELDEVKNINTLKEVIEQVLKEHGGFAEKDYIFNILANIFLVSSRKKDNFFLHKNRLEFLISKLLHEEFEEVGNLSNFKKLYKIKGVEIDHLDEIVQELVNMVEKEDRILKTEELIGILTNLASYQKHQKKLNTDYSFDLADVLKNDLFQEDEVLINKNKSLYSILQAVKHIEQNKFGYWGVYNWPTIKPRTINDKIYLVLDNYKEPLHFEDIADRINKIGFDHKKAHPATAHNELISDEKYILVGRGLYGLKEWGYKKGTVKDVIIDILKDEKKALTKEEIIEKVFEKRMVKESTILLSLADRDVFSKVREGYVLV